MYYVQSHGHLLNKTEEALTKSFGDKAEVRWYNGKLYIRFKPDAGFPGEDHFLTKEQIGNGMCGGGRIDGLDGKMFTLEAKEVQDWLGLKNE